MGTASKPASAHWPCRNGPAVPARPRCADETLPGASGKAATPGRGPARRPPVPGPDLARGERDRPATDVRVAADLVGMGMVAVVLGDPPAVAEPNQEVAVNP